MCVVIEKTTIINEIRLLKSLFPDKASIVSFSVHVIYGNGAPVQFNPTCLDNGQC